MANDLLQERIQHSGILWLTCPANYWDVMFHRKLVSQEVTVLDPRIYHKDGKKKKKKRTRNLCLSTQSMCWFLQNTSKRAEETLRALPVDRELQEPRVIRKHGPEREKPRMIERKYIVRRCSSCNFGLITAALVKPFEMLLLKPSVEVLCTAIGSK